MKKTNKYYENNKELCKERAKKWVYDHYDLCLKKSKEYYYKNTQDRLDYCHKRDEYLRKKYYGMSSRQSAMYGIKNVIKIYKRSKGLCEHCGALKKKNNHHIHHLDEAGRGTYKAIINKKVN